MAASEMAIMYLNGCRQFDDDIIGMSPDNMINM
jgi:hypothetical protein